MWCFEHQDKLTGMKTIGEAMRMIRTEHGEESIEADFEKIRRTLLRRVASLRRLARLARQYEADSPETIDQILDELREQAEGLLEDLEE
jgi:uncharacterized protein YcbK (DUF882 family)